MVLFGENGAWLVHHYWVFGDCVSHCLLCGPFMAEFLQFTNGACTDARSVAKRGRDTGVGSDELPGRLVSSATTHRASDDDPPARKSARVVTYASADMSSPLGLPASVPIVQYQASLSLSLSLPRFATAGAASDDFQSPSVETQLCRSG